MTVSLSLGRATDRSSSLPPCLLPSFPPSILDRFSYLYPNLAVLGSLGDLILISRFVMGGCLFPFGFLLQTSVPNKHAHAHAKPGLTCCCDHRAAMHNFLTVIVVIEAAERRREDEEAEAKTRTNI